MMKNKRIEYIGFIVVGFICLLIFFSFYSLAFPEASVDIGITNQDAKEISNNFLLSRNFDLAGYEQSVIFSSFGEAVIYLEKTMGIEKANEVMRNDIDLWFFRTRFFMPLFKTEYSVSVSPKDGAIIGFEQDILDEDIGAKIEQEEAKMIAVDFLLGMDVDLTNFELISFSSEERKNRVDHYFKWEKKDYSVANATYRIGVSVYGDYVGYYKKYLYVPESFSRDYQNERSYGVVLTLISYVFMIILVILSLWTFIVNYKRNEVKMKFAIYLAAIVGVLVVADMVNSMPLVFSSYPTTITKSVFFATLLLSTVIGALIYMLIIVMSGAGGEVLTRKVLLKKTSDVTDFFRHIFGRDFVGSTIRGYSLGFFFLAYITMFYLVGRNFFDIWIPADAGYSNMLNTFLPFLYPLTIGVLAAVSEEFLFRFFAIPLTKKYTKSIFLALLIPAMIWALGHSTYTVFPVYVRAVELTIAGVIFGYMFVKYDIMTVLIAHYVIDAMLVGMPLLRSSNTYYFVSGIVVVGLMLVPAFVAGVGFFRKKLLS
ncbi:MAG: CPBP family intramembrane glutamic endopeptidase [archaeon]